ncbi:MAG: PepSY-associated TM helix domain-containing protein [Sphingomonadales bacterium]
MTTRGIRTWYLWHKWTSIVCTAFMLLLCVTGLPLVFHEEIDELTGAHPPVAEMPEGTPLASLDTVVRNALAAQPGEVMTFMSWDDHEPIVYATTAPTVEAQDDFSIMGFDARTGERIDIGNPEEGFMHIMAHLHIDLFAGLWGTLFLGVMGLLFVVAIVSGVVLYGPFMRKLDFGTVRAHRSTRLKWLDLHNLLGIVTLAWIFVVGFTGVINTLATPIIKFWQVDQLAQIVKPYEGLPPVTDFASIDQAVKTAREAAPGMKLQFVAWPGTGFSSKHHYAAFIQGDTPLTSKLLKPALIDAQTGELTAMRDLPWYAQALLLSQPLHFGDYGGLGLKIVWGLLDIATIVVLGSGLYLWLGRRKTSIEARIEELERGGDLPGPIPEPAE